MLELLHNVYKVIYDDLSKNHLKSEDIYFKKHLCQKISIENESIYIPLDHFDPLSTEICEWCAANAKTSSVTELYLILFGIIGSVRGGFDVFGELTEIIHFNNDMSCKKNFIENFKKIASTNIGRVLLYVIFREIRRYENKDGLYVGSVNKADIRLSEQGSKFRNLARNISIVNNEDNGFYFPCLNSGEPEEAQISFSGQVMKTSVIDHDFQIINHYRPNDIGLFHELLHWLQFLRHPERAKAECTNVASSTDIRKFVPAKGYENTVAINLGRIYFKELNDEEFKNSKQYWCRESGIFNLGDLRVILGSTDSSLFLEYDDLSENLYREVVNEPLRYGHEAISDYKTYIEKSSVIKKVISNVKKAKKRFKV